MSAQGRRLAGQLDHLVRKATDYEHAAKELAAMTARVLPVGSRVAVTLGRARVIVEIEAAGSSWWSRPSYVTARNVTTGKVRHFDAGYSGHQLTVLSLPKAS